MGIGLVLFECPQVSLAKRLSLASSVSAWLDVGPTFCEIITHFGRAMSHSNAAVSDRLCRAVLLLERSKEAHIVGGEGYATLGRRKPKDSSLEREKQALHELRELLTGWETLGLVNRHELCRAISALFQCLDHREQSLRFLADQTLDAVFRKFVLKFQPEKVVANLLSELNRRGTPARAICAALQKLNWTIGRTKAQRASTYVTHLMAATTLCLQRPEESVQTAVERLFPAIFTQIGPSVTGIGHAERAEELFSMAVANLELGGPKNRAAATVIAHLARLVPSIVHKSFYSLSAIVFEANDAEHRARLAGALNTLRMMWPHLVGQFGDSSLLTLQKLLCKVLCCLYSQANEVLVAALELLKECAQFAADQSTASVFNFNPLLVQSADMSPSPFGSPVQRDSRGRSVGTETKASRDADETESVLSMCTGTSKMSVWSSMGDLGLDTPPRVAAIPSEGGGLSIDELDVALAKLGVGPVKNDGNAEEEDEEEEDKFSVISAELFVDPLMNCFHEQKGAEQQRHKASTASGGRAEGTATPSQSRRQTLGAEGHSAILAHLPATEGNAHSADCTFWVHAALVVAKRFLLAGHGQLREDSEVRISHKILALDFLGAAALREPRMGANLVLTHEDGHHQALHDVFHFIGHDDDNLAIAALNYSFNVHKWHLLRGSAAEKGKLLWQLKKTLHSQRNPSRLKGVFHAFAHSVPLLCADPQLLAAACEYAIASRDCDYFLVKTSRAEFFSQIRWSLVPTASARLQLQSACVHVFLLQLFDPDPRIHRATLEALPVLVRNTQFGVHTSLFASFPLPQCLEAERERRLPMLLGLPSAYSFCPPDASAEHSSLASNLAHVLNSLLQLALENFSERRFGLALSLAHLAAHFPPNSEAFAPAWLSTFSSPTLGCTATTARSWNSGQPSNLPRGAFQLLVLLLECAENNCSSLSELSSLLSLVSTLFASISESLILHRCATGEQDQVNPSAEGASAVPSLWGIRPQKEERGDAAGSLVEQCLLLHLRVLNFYYAIVAEERIHKSDRSALAAVSSEGIVGGAAALLARPGLLLQSRETSSAAEEADPSHVGTANQHSSKAINFSLLVGSGLKQNRPTSFTHSLTLCSLERVLRAAYKAFIDQLNPEAHNRFLEPLEAAMHGLCAILEMADLAFARPFLDELLLYQRMLMDISPSDSARLIHQLIKCVFNENAQMLSGSTLRQAEIWDQHAVQSNDPAELYVSGALNNFTVFTAFVRRSEFTEAITAKMGGWMVPNRLTPRANSEENVKRIGDLLHQFEPFITHLLKLYPFTNSVPTKRAILECICSLCLFNVRYELLDRNGKFLARVVGQLRQLSPAEDAPLLAHIFAFLCVLARIQFMKGAEVENFLVELFGRMDERNCTHILEATKIVLLDVTLNAERRARQPKEQLRILSRISAVLATEFATTFAHSAALSAECWIILLNALRGHEESWSDVSLECFSRFLRHCCSANPSQSPAGSPSRRLPEEPAPREGKEREEAQCTRQLFLGTMLLANCSPTIFRPIDEFFHCLECVLARAESAQSQGQLTTTDLRRQLASHLCPLLFVLLNQLDEQVLLMRLGTIFGEKDERNWTAEQRQAQAVDFLGRTVACALVDSVVSLCGDSELLLMLAKKPESLRCAEKAPLFLFFSLLQCIRAGKSPQLMAAIQRHLPKHATEVDPRELAFISPAVFAFWSQLLLALNADLHVNGYFDCLSPHCKVLLVHLIVHRLCEQDKGVARRNDSSLGTLANVPVDFCVELLRIEDTKLFRKLVSRLPQESVQSVICKLEQHLREQLDAALLPRFNAVLAKSDDPVHSELAARLAETSANEHPHLVGEYLHGKRSIRLRRPTTFCAAELAQLHSEDRPSVAQFYATLAAHASSEPEMRQMCAGLFILAEKGQIEAVIRAISGDWLIRRRFLHRLFALLREQTGGGEGTGGRAQLLLDTLLHVTSQAGTAAQKLLVLAETAHLLESAPETLRFPEGALADSESAVERFLNESFLRTLVECTLAQRSLPPDYFAALKLFFSLQSVRNVYADNDMLTVRSLHQFVALLWEHVEKDVPRWLRLHVDKQHWAVRVAGAEEGDELGEQILKLFATVQHVVFAARESLLPEEAQAAFQALLGISLLQRMALAPESALRLDWQLALDIDGATARISVPLVQIHVLNDPAVLKDFCWRALWLGWSSKSQFEDVWMSLFGVLSFTPTNPTEVQQRASADSTAAVQQQLLASSLAIEVLTNLLLQTLLFPNPGSPVNSHYVFKHRERRENYLFLDTECGAMALAAKVLTARLRSESQGASPSELFAHNLEATRSAKQGYGIGQTSLYHLWSICGLLEGRKGPSGESGSSLRESTSDFLLAQSNELDTTSSLRALFDTFMHWLASSDVTLLPLSVLSATLRSLSLLSDLFHDPALYRQTFAALRPLMADQQKTLLEEHPSRGYVILLLLKCASVLEWADLHDHGETSTAKFVEHCIEGGLHCPHSQFVRECTLHGILYLLQSLHADSLHSAMAGACEWLVAELQRMQKMTDILVDCQNDLMDYNRLTWAVLFAVVQSTLPVEGRLKDSFFRLVSHSFVDPRLPTWQKEMLTRGIESLVLHSCSYAPRFRKVALECFETYQLQPAHLPFALSIYLTSIYRELQEGGEYAYAVNKAFPAEDFHKMLNVFSFYASSPSEDQSHSIVELTTDLVCAIWSKEAVLECIWSLLVPPVATQTTPKIAFSSKSERKVEAPFSHPLQAGDEEPTPSSALLIAPPLHLSRLDRSLVHVLHLIFKKLFLSQPRVCMELALNFMVPKLKLLENGAMARCLTLVLLCSANGGEEAGQRIHFLLHSSDPLGSPFTKVAFSPVYTRTLISAFVAQGKSIQMNNGGGSGRELESTLGRLAG